MKVNMVKRENILERESFINSTFKKQLRYIFWFQIQKGFLDFIRKNIYKKKELAISQLYLFS